jgi:hypothetical protein
MSSVSKPISNTVPQQQQQQQLFNSNKRELRLLALKNTFENHFFYKQYYTHFFL